MALTKIIVDSLNEVEIGKLVVVETNAKGIDKLEAFLNTKNLSDVPKIIEFLRDLQNLRSSGAAHRKSENYRKIAKRFGIPDKDLRIVYEEILGRAIALLTTLAKCPL